MRGMRNKRVSYGIYSPYFLSYEKETRVNNKQCKGQQTLPERRRAALRVDQIFNQRTQCGHRGVSARERPLPRGPGFLSVRAARP